ncbi:uncharacterized protein LOC126895148 [Daktulosphaira vitifoliae]|uniref:uncharacterized protein LOC126895148 n=1 Tax=Daktulosphaira vitifoliae TaxID=58002 RepID=UPI0021AAF7F1|nr:uncharacterized protein LOC126895148 [Daktulosphaira vitifoliae]
MSFYIFIIMYLASFSNAIIFKYLPLNEIGELTDTCRTDLEKLFNNNKNKEEGMDCKKFIKLLSVFKMAHLLDEAFIRGLFKEEVIEKNGLMTLEQFLNQAKLVVKITEWRINNSYEKMLNLDKRMIKNELTKSIEKFKTRITQDEANEIMTRFDDINAQDIGMQAFRNIYANLYYVILGHSKEHIHNKLELVIHFI